MNNKYEYDTSGVSSSLLAVGLLLPVILGTYSRAFSWGRSKTYSCTCKLCATQKPARSSLNLFRVVFVLACALIALPLRNIIIGQYGRGHGFNPYEILNVGSLSSKGEIKKAYSQRMRETKLRIRDKAEAKKALQEIIKAHETLTDDKLRENWDAFGAMETKEAHVIAIPQWAMTKNMSSLMLLLYILALGLGFPKMVSLMWQYSFNYSAVGVSYLTTEALYHQMKTVRRCGSMYALIGWLASCSAELQQRAIKTPEPNLARLVEVFADELAIAITEKQATPTYVLCLGMLCLRNPKVLALIHEDDLRAVQSEMLKATLAIRVISLSLKQKDIYYLSYHLERCIVQSVCNPAYWEMQYTDVSFEQVFIKAYEGKKTEEPRSAADQELDARMFRTKITAVDLYTALNGPISKEEHISPAAEVSLRVVLTREGHKSSYLPIRKPKKPKTDEFDIGDLEVVDTNECPEINPKELDKHPILIRHSTTEPLHAPFFKEPQEYAWAVVIEINGMIVSESPDFTPGAQETEVLFRIPPLQSLTPAGTAKATIEIGLISKKFFNRDTIWRKTLAFA